MTYGKLGLFLATAAMTMVGCGGPVPTREEIVAKFPDAEAGSPRPENLKILCPFLRMLNRAGLVDDPRPARGRRAVAVGSVARASREFGCTPLECGAVALLVSSRQGPSGLDLERLHDAAPISHECGLTWGKGETEVNPMVRQATLDRLAELADENGNLVYEDIERVKLEICAAQNVANTPGGEIEMKVMFAYLGGVENGSVRLSDVGRLLNATMPETKTTSWVNWALVAQVE
jgi:hypothetical protein